MADYTWASGTAIVWADTTDYSSTASGLTRTAQIDLTSIASGAARQGARVDLGATRTPLYHCLVGLEYDVAPAATALAELYFGTSPNTTVLPAGMGGSDAAYKAGEEAEWVRQLRLFVPLPLTNDAATTVQVIDAGLIAFPDRYVAPVFYNTGGQALEGDAVEMYIALIPITHGIA